MAPTNYSHVDPNTAPSQNHRHPAQHARRGLDDQRRVRNSTGNRARTRSPHRERLGYADGALDRILTSLGRHYEQRSGTVGRPERPFAGRTAGRLDVGLRLDSGRLGAAWWFPRRQHGGQLWRRSRHRRHPPVADRRLGCWRRRRSAGCSGSIEVGSVKPDSNYRLSRISGHFPPPSRFMPDMKGPMMSMGRGKTTVEFWSAPSSSKVCR